MLLPERIGDWVRQDSSLTYDREAIFDYINGAGEVYRSYAFRDVLVARYARDSGDEVTVELFDMGLTEDAYGVFSYARESEEAGIGGGFERKGRVLCFWQDRYYVCVAAESAVQAQPVLEEIARGISNGLPSASAPPVLRGTLPDEGFITASDRFFHTHQSLNYHYYLARENVLNLGSNTDVVLGRYDPGSTYLIVVSYQSQDDAVRALASFRQHVAPATGPEAVQREAGKFLASDQHGRFVVVVIDASSNEAANALRLAARERIAQLAP